MPANLPPQYYEAEKLYRLAKTNEQKVEALQAMLSIMPKHKGTDRLRAELTSKIAKFSQEAKRKVGRKGSPYSIKREEAGQVILVGLPNAGKSKLLSSVTQASTDVADYPFTTQTPIPGMMNFENIQIQLVDTPPITSRGSQLWLGNIFRGADVLLIVVDLGNNPLGQIETVFEELDKLSIKPVGYEMKEAITQGETQKKVLVVGNKSDLDDSGESYRKLSSQYGTQFPLISISAEEGIGLEGLKEEIYKALDIIRVYTKAPGEKPDLEQPVILKRESTVEDAAQSIHKDFRSKLKYTQVWGSGKYSGQKVNRRHILEDGDIIELHI